MTVDADRVRRASGSAEKHLRRMRGELKKLERCYNRLGNGFARDPRFAAERAALRGAIAATGQAIEGLAGSVNGVAARTQFNPPAPAKARR